MSAVPLREEACRQGTRRERLASPGRPSPADVGILGASMSDTAAQADTSDRDTVSALTVGGRNGRLGNVFPHVNGLSPDVGSVLSDVNGSDDPDDSDRWQNRAACRGMHPSLFYPERGESKTEAAAVCRTCPVAAECLEYANANNERHGIWGGTSERQRLAMRREQRRAATTAARRTFPGEPRETA